MKRGRLRNRYIVYNHIVLVALILVITALSLSLFSLFQKERQSTARKNETHAQLVDVRARREVLERDLSLLNTTRGQEALVRNTFDVAPPGEEVVVLLDPPAPTSTSPVKKGLWSFITGLFQ